MKRAKAPDVIYLQVQDECGEYFSDILEATHCADRIYKSDVVYVRKNKPRKVKP